MNPKKIKKLLNALKKPSERSLDAFDDIDGEIRSLTGRVQKKINAKALENVNGEIEKFRKDIDLEPILSAVESLKGETGGIYKELATRIEDELSNLVSQLQGGIERLNKDDERIGSISEELTTIREATADDIRRALAGNDSVRTEVQNAETTLRKMMTDTEVSLGKALFDAQQTSSESVKNIQELRNALEQFRIDFLSKLANVGGGNANRNIAINGNGSVLSTYTDINFKNSSTIGWTATVNNTTKQVDITASVLTGGVTTPAGANQQVQYNDGGAFGASSVFTWNKNTSVLSVGVGHVQAHGIMGDASDGFHIETITKQNLATFGAGNSGNATFYVPTNFSSTVSIQNSASVRGVLSVGQDGSVVGVVSLHAGSSGRVRLQAPSIVTSYTLTFPADDGSAGQYLITDGNGITQWASVAGGSGINRSTSIITANTTGGTTASTDYVYFANAGLSFTLPTAISNTNLYTVKNTSGSSVLIATSAGQTIDGSNTALLPTDNESLSFISNGSVWGVV